MCLHLNKFKKALSALFAALLLICNAAAINAYAVKGFNDTDVYSFCNETENVYSKPAGTEVTSGNLTWQLYDNYESRSGSNGLYIAEGYIRLKANNPLNSLSDFKMEIVYSSSAEEGEAGNKPFLVLSTKKYAMTQLMTDSSVLLGISENGDVYCSGDKINHPDGSEAEDILSSRNPGINSGDECKVAVRYIDGKLTVTLTYNSGKTTVKLVENYKCGIAKLQQFILGGDKSNRLDKVTYKSVSVSEYGEYVPSTESGLKAIVKVGDTMKEYTDSSAALTEALKQMKNGIDSALVLYDDMILGGPITVDDGKSFTVDLNGHTLNRNCHSTMVSNGYVFWVGENASLTIEDSAPDSQNYSTAIKGGVITGGAGDNVGGCFQMNENSNLTMTGGSVVGCITNDHGGAIRVYDSGVIINISNAGFYSNMTLDSADNAHGGAIYSDYNDCRITVKSSIFEGNYSEDNGGAVYINDGKFNASGCIFSGNKCLDDGGAVYIERDSKATFDNCTFVSNRSDGQGGAVYCNSSDGTRFSGSFGNNTAGGAGGALFINGDAVSIQDAVIIGNKTGEKGGAMYVDEMYDINVQGLLKVKDNYKNNNSRDDIFLDSIGIASAKIYDGGLYDGSEVWVLTSGSSQTVSDNISAYQQRYFHCDDSSKGLQFSADSSKTQRQTLITSVIGNGKVSVIVAFAAVIIVAAAVITSLKTKKKKGADNK